MRIGFLADGSVHDPSAWSGTVARTFQELSERFDVVPLEMPNHVRITRAVRKAIRPTGIDLAWNPYLNALLARRASRMARLAGVDAIFALAHSAVAAALCEQFPVFHCSDATFAAMQDYYRKFSNLSRTTLHSGNALEQKTLHGSAAVILSSEWAARSVRQQYGRADNVHVVPFGANLKNLPDRDRWVRSGTCNLVFVGSPWHDKGADLAVEATRILNERGTPSVIHIVGCSPPENAPLPDFVRIHGFLRKDVEDDYNRLTDLLAKSDFLIHPARFEAYGIAMCEAAAFATPAVARRTGGVPTVVDHDVTGVLIPSEAGPIAYADAIEKLRSDPTRYLEMRRRAFEKAHRVLNWKAWGDAVEAIINSSSSQPGKPVWCNPEPAASDCKGYQLKT